MALNIENIFGHYNLDTKDPGIVNIKESGVNQGDLSTNQAESNHFSFNQNIFRSGENEVTPCTDDETSEKNCNALLTPSVFVPSALSASNDKVTFFLGEDDIEDDIPEPLASADASKEFFSRQSDKIKRVHFNTKIQTFTFEPDLSIKENHHFTQELTGRNVFTNMNYESENLPGTISSVLWKSESNLAFRNLKPCSQCGFVEDWGRCDRHIRQPKRELSSIIKYSRFDNEVISEAPKSEIKGWQKLKKTCSFIRRAKEEDEDRPSSSMSGRLSKSMLNLKTETTSFMEKVMSKVMNKKKDLCPIPEFSEVNTGFTTNVSTRSELKNPPILKRARSIFFGKKQEDEKEFECCGLRSSVSMLNLKRKENFSIPGMSKVDDAKGITRVSKKEPPRLRRMKSLYIKKNAEVEGGHPSSASGRSGWHLSKSMLNLRDDTKSLFDRFTTKLMKK